MNSVLNRSSRGLLGSATVALVLLFTINVFNFADRYILSSVQPRIEDEFFAPNDPDAQYWFGVSTTAFLVSYMVAAPLFGWLADRMSRWLIIGLGVIGWSLASGGTGLAATYSVLLITRTFVGIGEAAYGPAAPAIISDLYPVERRATVLSWFYLAMPVGGALGYAFGGLVAQHWDWRWAFYLSVPPGILLGVWALLMSDPPRGAMEPAVRAVGRASLRDYLILAKTPSYAIDTLGMVFMSFAIGGISVWMPRYINKFREVPDLGHIGVIFGAITAVTGITATLLGGVVADRLQRRWPGAYFSVSGISMIAALPLFLLILVTPFPQAWFFIFWTEFCMFFSIAPTNTILANVTHPALRGSAFALNIFMIHAFGDAISPPLIGKISGWADGNMNIGFAAVSVSILLSGLFWLAGSPFLKRDTELAPTRIAE